MDELLDLAGVINRFAAFALCEADKIAAQHKLDRKLAVRQIMAEFRMATQLDQVELAALFAEKRHRNLRNELIEAMADHKNAPMALPAGKTRHQLAKERETALTPEQRAARERHQKIKQLKHRLNKTSDPLRYVERIRERYPELHYEVIRDFVMPSKEELERRRAVEVAEYKRRSKAA